ncbi:MAG: PEFG-CTERM sorting domain-containing protein [Thermoproteota archaeon]|nr:PEFG-CTERM sorting domain-containing protein [Thermoproteota archaeon]
MNYKAYTLMSILLASLASVVPIGITYAQTNATTNNATNATNTEEANAPAINSTGGQWTTFDLTVGGQTRPLEYRIQGGTVQSMAVYNENQTLGITINSTGNGTLALRLPRDIIDSKTANGEDADFAAFIDNAEYEQPGEIEPSAANRTLLIGFPAGTGAIDVIGTTTGGAAGGTNATTAGTNATTGGAAGGTNATIPEFSTVAIVVLAIAIVGIIIATSRQGRFSFGQRM